MYRNIYNHISDSIDDRATAIVNYIATNSKKHVELTNSMLEIQNEILEFLPEDYKALFFDYEALCSERDSVKNLILFKQGIMDGIKVRNLVSGNSEKKCPEIQKEGVF